ncbi:hypothetical protein SAMN06265376_105100 [Dokdonia pacifica]|uniref:Uncharacterized protein n=1 Tax=Dokdonia pacifica TaxID=1627892 RepID=A0A239ASC0_9FLAO|nr:hypothetical protein SAMN06265376_105100 [Dokdonia pacifica]
MTLLNKKAHQFLMSFSFYTLRDIYYISSKFTLVKLSALGASASSVVPSLSSTASGR